MMISTRGRYALRTMLDLAQHYKEGFVSLTDISKRQNISVKYLETIVSILNRAGFVESMRGKNGGYRLTKSVEKYSVGSILLLTEGSLAPVSCIQGNSANCDRASDCLTLPLWINLDTIINNYLDNITLSDLLNGNLQSDK